MCVRKELDAREAKNRDRDSVVDIELQGDLLNAKSQYRDELKESNTLLLMIYKYLDKMLGVDETPVSVSRLLHRIF